jgi:hypothetical protein
MVLGKTSIKMTYWGSNPAMTRHYTHVGELAAGRAVALLPSVMGEATPEPTKREQGEILREIKMIATTISAKNWQQKKASLLALLSGTREA